ncbi:hypothetical protein [Kingella kingae]|nr:hypothetical protein [Kingella kingae]
MSKSGTCPTANDAFSTARMVMLCYSWIIQKWRYFSTFGTQSSLHFCLI